MDGNLSITLLQIRFGHMLCRGEVLLGHDDIHDHKKTLAQQNCWPDSVKTSQRVADVVVISLTYHTRPAWQCDFFDGILKRANEILAGFFFHAGLLRARQCSSPADRLAQCSHSPVLSACGSSVQEGGPWCERSGPPYEEARP